MSTTAVWDALSGDSDFSPIFRFAEAGDRISGVIVEEPKLLPLTEYKSTEPKIGPDGKPVMQIMVVLASEQAQDDNHDGRWRVYLDKPLLKAAVKRALVAADVETLEIGGEITITFVGLRETRSGGAAKDFTVEYSAAEGFGDGPIGRGEFFDANEQPVEYGGDAGSAK